MNLFVLDLDPKECAKQHCDIHVGKLAVEACQLMSNVRGGPLQPSHMMHPLTRWVGQRPEHYAWAYEYAHALSREFMFRYNKPHAVMKYLPILRPTRQDVDSPKWFRGCTGLTSGPQTPAGAVVAYRKYYVEKGRGWELRRLVRVLACRAIDVPMSSATLPQMLWYKGRPRPDWVPDFDAEKITPSREAVRAAKAFALGERLFDPIDLTPSQTAVLMSILDELA